MAILRASLGLTKLIAPELLSALDTAVKGIEGNPNFPNPPVEVAAMKALRDKFAASIADAADGGKKAIVERNKQREVVIHTLQQLARYVEINCKNDLGIFLSSGLQPAAGSRTPQPLPQPRVGKVVHGTAGQLLVSVNGAKGAASHDLSWGALGPGGAPPASWTTIGFTNSRGVKPVNNLTPGTTYAFRVRALGPLGYTEWSDSVTRMCN